MKFFLTKKTITYHLKNIKCKAVENIESEDNEMDSILKCMSRLELHEEIIMLRNKETNNGINITNNTNNTKNINNGTIVNHYLKPNIDFMSCMKYWDVLLKNSKFQTNKVIMKCVRDTYNSDVRPENRSIKINLKSGFAEVYIAGDLGRGKTITVPNDDACYDILYNLSKDIKKAVEDYSYEYNMSGSKVDDVIEEIEDVECDNVNTSKLYGSYVKAGLL
jgi:hypothetical protein